MSGKIKGFKPKSKKGTKKRLKKTINSSGQVKLQAGRTNSAHRMIGKSRQRVLKSKRQTVLSDAFKKYLTVM